MKLGHLPRIVRARPGTCLMVRGGPGIGKTEVVAHTLKQEGVPYAKFIAAQETPESVTGFLWIDPATGSCNYLPPRRLREIQAQMEKGQKVALIVDEYKSGDRMTHNALQQLIREHAVGDWIARGDMYVYALTNRDEDRANTVRLAAPTVNRVIQVEIEPDFEFWSGWAGGEGMKEGRVHSDILGWLRAVFIGAQELKSTQAKEWAKDKSLLFCSPAPKDESAFPTPRSHEMASDVLMKFPNEDDSFILEVLCGTFGTGPAYEFLQWRKVGKEAQQIVNDIMNGRSVRDLDVGMQFFVNSQLASEYAKNVKKAAGPVVKYLAELESEFAMILINDLAQISDALTKEKDWIAVVQKHRKVALAGKR